MSERQVLAAAASEHEARAIELMTRVREVAQAIQGFNFATKGRRQKIANFVHLPDEFFEQMAVACELYPEIAAASGLTGAECRSIITMSRSYGSVVLEMRTQAKGLDDTIAEIRADVGRRALRGYMIAQRVNKEDEKHKLIPHLDAIKRTLNRGRPRKKPEEEVPVRPVKSRAARIDEGGKEVTAEFKAGKDL